MELQPTTGNERVRTLDIIRGVCLLGILLVNIFAFASPQPHVDLKTWFVEAIDIIWYQNLQIYVQSSFYPLFSMLFGYGLAMQYAKAKSTGKSVYRFIPKRLAILFVIGMLHAFFVWWGDIIATYAFAGFFLFAMLRLRPALMIAIAVILTGLFQGLYIAGLGLAGMLHQELEQTALDIMKVEDAIVAYATGNYFEAFTQRLTDLSVQMSPLMWILSLFVILPYMLVGAAAAKWQLVERAKELKVAWVIAAVIGVAGGLFLKSTPYIMTNNYLYNFVQIYLGGPLLAVGYAALIVVICLLPLAVKLLRPVEKMGRMSMSMYILQSIIGTLLFYQYGLGFYGKFDVPTMVYIALTIYVIQLILAELWLSKFKQGPLEMAVKKWTYHKMNVEK